MLRNQTGDLRANTNTLKCVQHVLKSYLLDIDKNLTLINYFISCHLTFFAAKSIVRSLKIPPRKDLSASLIFFNNINLNNKLKLSEEINDERVASNLLNYFESYNNLSLKLIDDHRKLDYVTKQIFYEKVICGVYLDKKSHHL